MTTYISLGIYITNYIILCIYIAIIVIFYKISNTVGPKV